MRYPTENTCDLLRKNNMYMCACLYKGNHRRLVFTFDHALYLICYVGANDGVMYPLPLFGKLPFGAKV